MAFFSGLEVYPSVWMCAMCTIGVSTIASSEHRPDDDDFVHIPCFKIPFIGCACGVRDAFDGRLELVEASGDVLYPSSTDGRW